MVLIVDVPAPDQPLPVHVAAVWGGFLYEGILAPAADHQRVRQILDSWGCGCLELVMAVCDYLPVLWQLIAEVWAHETLDFPGVFEYEVISSFGEWLGDWLLAHDGRLPEPAVAEGKIRELIAAFFDESKREIWRGPLQRPATDSAMH